MKRTDSQRRATDRFVHLVGYALIPVGFYLVWAALHVHKAVGTQDSAPLPGKTVAARKRQAPLHFSPSVLTPGQILPDSPGDAYPDIPRHDWLALIDQNNRWSLVPTDIELQQGTVMQGQPGTVLYLRGQGLTAGNVTGEEAIHSMVEIDKDLSDPSMGFSFGYGPRYILRLTKDGQLVLNTTDGQHPTILDDSDPIAVALVWSGDLDNDGKLDLALKIENENENVTCLFLSSGASDGQVVRNAGCSAAH